MKLGRLTPLAAVAAAMVTSCAAKEAPLPYGEALIVVDTDLPVPTLAGRLRVDLYDEHGTWFESRDIGRSDPTSWPASFSVFSDDDSHDKRVLVRLRGYPEGITRDYAGERYEAREPYVAPRPTTSLAELCANAPELPLGGRVTARRGTTPLTELVEVPPSPTGIDGPCAAPTRTGAVAAKVRIETAGKYRFDVADAVPYMSESTLFVRSRCDDPSSQLACSSEPNAVVLSSGHLPRLDAFLQPGTYYLLTGGSRAGWPADLTLESLPIDQPLPPETPVDAGAPISNGPRLLRPSDGADLTPPSEPLPTATIDRLLLLRLQPGVRGKVEVTLRAACAGTMARLGEEPTVPDLATATTCSDTEGTSAPLVESPLDPALTVPTTSVQGEASRERPCTASAPSGVTAACVPGGAFLFGSRVSTAQSAIDLATPERIALMSPFFMDKYEVSVGRFRRAVANGLAFDPSSLTVQEAPFPSKASADPAAYCTYSTTPMDREDLPLTCVTWSLARALCRAEGGDLPTEAQWEYAAVAAGREYKTLFPWGDDAASCTTAVVRRVPPSLAGMPNLCDALGVGPVSVEAANGGSDHGGDVTPAGIVGLGANVSEWVVDGGGSFSSACWRAAGVTDPACIEDDAPLRAHRGSAWLYDEFPVSARLAFAGDLAVGIPFQVAASSDLGFRCVYPGVAP